MLRADPEADLSALIVFSPILPADTKAAAVQRAKELADPRARFYWDAEKAVGKALKPRIEGCPGAFAWDVYCFFDATAQWRAEVPQPARWAHQLAGADEEHFFGAKLGDALRSWTLELTGSSNEQVENVPFPDDVMTIPVQDLRPITEVLLDEILDELSKRDDLGVEPEALSRIATELRLAMAEASKAHLDKLPRALRRDGQVMVLAPSECAPGPTLEETGR